MSCTEFLNGKEKDEKKGRKKNCADEVGESILDMEGKFWRILIVILKEYKKWW